MICLQNTDALNGIFSEFIYWTTEVINVAPVKLSHVAMYTAESKVRLQTHFLSL